MARDIGIIQQFDTAYNEAYRAWDSFFPEAERDMKFYLGAQWDESEKRALHDEGRNTFVFNRIRPVINMITGYQRQHRLSSIVTPIEDSDQATADQLSQLLLYVMQSSDGYRMVSDCFGGAVKTGWNLASVWMDYRDDPVNGDIRFAREPWNGFILDPYFTRLDLSDCSYVLRRKYLSVQQVASLLPGQEEEVYEMHKIGWERDDKFTWLPYQRQPSGMDLMAYNEYYEQKWTTQNILIDQETGQYIDWEGDREQFKRLKEINDAFELSTRQRKYIEMHIIVNDQVMRTVENPYGLDEYPFVPFVSIFEPESDQWSLKCQSLIRCMIDPQREANRRRSQMIDLLDSQINSGWIATEGSVVNPRSLFQASQGKVVWREKDALPGAIEKIQPAQIPPSMFQLQQQFDADIKEIAGINDAAFGMPESGNESGIMMLLRQGAAITNLQDVFDNLRFSQKALSMKILKLIQTWTPEKVKRIINDEPTPEFYEKKFTKYDCVVQEGVLTDTQRQIYFRQLVDLTQLGAPIPPDALLKAAPLQGKAELMEQVQEAQQAQAQQAQQQQQVQNELINAQMQLAQSSSLEKVAGAKERFTRSVANMGLEDERASSAVKDRSQAVYDQIRAMKELDAMELQNVKEALLITEMMREQNQVEEEQIKQDDVMLSASVAESPPPGAVIQQTSEVFDEETRI